MNQYTTHWMTKVELKQVLVPGLLVTLVIVALGAPKENLMMTWSISTLPWKLSIQPPRC